MVPPEGSKPATGEASFRAIICPSKYPSFRSNCMPLEDIFLSWSVCSLQVWVAQPGMSRQPDPTENKYDEGDGSNKPQFKSECSQVIVMNKFFPTKYCDNSILVSIAV